MTGRERVPHKMLCTCATADATQVLCCPTLCSSHIWDHQEASLQHACAPHVGAAGQVFVLLYSATAEPYGYKPGCLSLYLSNLRSCKDIKLIVVYCIADVGGSINFAAVAKVGEYTCKDSMFVHLSRPYIVTQTRWHLRITGKVVPRHCMRAKGPFLLLDVAGCGASPFSCASGNGCGQYLYGRVRMLAFG